MKLLSTASSAKSNASVGFLSDKFDQLLLFGLIGSLPMLASQALNLWTRPHFQFFPLAWITFVYTLIRNGTIKSTTSITRNRIAAILVLASFLILAFAIFLANSPWMAQLASILLVWGWMLRRLGDQHWYTTFLWLLLLLVTLPLPTNLDTQLINWLQVQSSEAASFLLDLVGTVHLLTGNVIEIKQGRLFVDQACSGVGSLYALTAVYVLFMVLQNRSLMTAALSLLSVPCWSWFGNVVRLFTIAWALDRFNLDFTKGWQHQAVGLFIFTLDVVCFLLTFEALSLVLKPLRIEQSNEAWIHKLYRWCIDWPKARKNLMARGGTIGDTIIPFPFRYFGSHLLSGLYLLLGVLSLGPLFGFGPWRSVDYKAVRLDLGSIQATMTSNLLPSEVAGLRLERFELTHREEYDFFGEYSATWFGVDSENGKEILISLDFPFPSFHPLEICYESLGNNFGSGIQDYELESSTGQQFVRSGEMVDLFGDRSRLYYVEFAPSGRCDKFSKSFWEVKFGRPINEVLFQLQILVKNSSGLSYSDNVKYRSLIVDIQKKLLPAIQSLE